MAGSGFFQTFNHDITAALNLVSSAGSNIYVQLVSALVTSAITLYVLWAGYQTLAGKIQTPLQDVLWNLAKFGVLLGFINNTDSYMTLSISALTEIKSELSSSEVKRLWADLDALLISTQSLGESLYGKDLSATPLTGWTARSLVWGGSVVLMLTVAGGVMIADATLILLFVTAPLFLFCLMFGFLRGMFNNWLQLIISSVLTLVFVSLVSAQSLVFMNKIVLQITQQAPNGNLITLGGVVLMAGVLMGLLVVLARYCATYIASVGVREAVRGMSEFGLTVATDNSNYRTGVTSRYVHALERRTLESHYSALSVSKSVEVSGDSSSTPGYLASVRMSQQAVANMKARSLT